MMEYKGYVGAVTFDSYAGLFHGDVLNTRDAITFHCGFRKTLGSRRLTRERLS